MQRKCVGGDAVKRTAMQHATTCAARVPGDVYNNLRRYTPWLLIFALFQRHWKQFPERTIFTYLHTCLWILQSACALIWGIFDVRGGGVSDRVSFANTGSKVQRQHLCVTVISLLLPCCDCPGSVKRLVCEGLPTLLQVLATAGETVT